MTDSHRHPSKPTAKQLHYLRDLALRTGQSFAYPETSAEASREIDRLKGAARTPVADRRRERLAVGREMAERFGGSAAIDLERELEGWGSTAGWSRHVEHEEEERRKERAQEEHASSWR
jgi:hypothetical protein